MVSALKGKIASLPETIEERQFRSQLAKAKEEYESLGIFKMKEKKALKERIQGLEVAWERAKKKLQNASASETAELEKHTKRIKEIENELTKDRPE